MKVNCNFAANFRRLSRLPLPRPHRQISDFFLLGINSVRPIFSKTGEWNPQLTLESRLEMERHWGPVIQELDQTHSEYVRTAADESKEKYYALSMFPYPSGNLHLGHVRVYTISDVVARYQRAHGKLVVHPMGWDAFGLPAENAALERGIHPKEWTYSNIKKMKQQLQGLGLSLDWNREFATCDPSYYKWTQFIFLKMFEHGLAFRKKGLVNWDPVDMTVLADEQIDENGCSWRSGAKVEKKYLTQWYLRSTAFSESLLQGLDEVDRDLWKDVVKLQKHWIGRCQGYRINFSLTQGPGQKEELPLSVYTEDLELIYGVSHLHVKQSHHLCAEYNIHEVGAVLPIEAIHPFTGDQLKIVVAAEKDMYPNKDIKLAIPCVSPVDQEVATRLGIPYRCVLASADGNILQDSQEFSGLSRSQALDIVRKKVLEMGIGGEKTSERLNDWLISRQRYWGTPIPVIHCNKCGSVPVPYEDLPVLLPDFKDFSGKSGYSQLAQNEDWVNVACPKCGSEARRESDTMDTFVDSTWYFLRYLDPHNDSAPCDPQVARRFMPVDLYVGGKEHAILHLYFARFVSHFLHKIGLMHCKEPFKNLLTQGMVKGESFRVKDSGKYLPRDKVDMSGPTPVEAETGSEVVVEWEKMSKSKHNGVNPEDVLAEYGVDSTRLCILSNVSPQSERNWSHIVYKGVLNWQAKVWNLVTRHRNDRKEEVSSMDPGQIKEWDRKIDDLRNHIVDHVNFEIEVTFHINAAISRLHEFVTKLGKTPADVASVSRAYERALGDLIIIISALAPHFAAELWVGLANVAEHKTHQWGLSVFEQSWPKIDEDYLMPLFCKVKGKDIQVRVPYQEFKLLNSDTAWSLIQQTSEFKSRISTDKVIGWSLQISGHHRATLSVTLDNNEQQKNDESASVSEEKTSNDVTTSVSV